MPSIVFHASELAACLGYHPYAPQHEAVCRVWRRAHPESYERAVESGLRDAHTLLRGEQAQEAMREACSHARPEGTPEYIHEAMAGILGVDMGSLSTPEKKAVMEEARRTVYGSYGQACESTALEELKSRGFEIELVSTYYKMSIGSTGSYEVRVGGKVDGLLPGAVLEIKSRASGLAYRIQPYEEPQVVAYMALTGQRKAVLAERLPLVSRGFFLFHEMHWSDERWETLRQGLLGIANAIRMLIEDATFAQKFSCSRTKNALIKKAASGGELTPAGRRQGSPGRGTG